MNLEAFRTLCANPNTSKADLIAHIMALKRVNVQFTAHEKEEICKILLAPNRPELRKLAKKFGRNLKRHK